MAGHILTTWGLVVEADELAGDEPPDTADGWLALARDAYLAQCPHLAAHLAAEAARVRVTAERLEPAALPDMRGATIGVSVVEVRPSSFDMAIRIRPAGEHADRPVDARCTLVLERLATGDTLPVPRAVRDELVAIQLAARRLC